MAQIVEFLSLVSAGKYANQKIDDLIEGDDPESKLCKAIYYEMKGRIEDAAALVHDYDNLENENLKNWFIMIHFLLIVRSGNLVKAEKTADKLHRIRENIEHAKELYIWINFSIAEYYREIGKMYQARTLLEALNIHHCSPVIKLRVKRTLGITFRHTGLLDQALSIYRDVLEIAKENGDLFNQGLIYNSLGSLFWTHKNLKQAYDYFNQALRVWNQFDNPLEANLVILNLGAIYKEYGDFQQSKDYLNRALEYFVGVGNYINISVILFELVQVGIFTENDYLIAKHLIRLEEISYDHPNDMIRLHLDISKALVYFSSDRLIDKVAAYRHLNAILDSDIIYYEISMIAHKTICELLLDEYSLYRNKVVLQEFNEHLQKLEQMRKQHPMDNLQIDVLILRGKLQRVKKQFREAREYFEEAKRISKDLELNMITFNIELELLALNVELQELDALIELHSRDEVETHDTSQDRFADELPVIFFIANSGGVTLFEYEFDTYIRSNVNMVSSVISAVNGLLKEIFEVNTNLEKIKHREFHILFHFDQDLVFTYVYKNESEVAESRFHSLVDMIQQREDIMEMLQSNQIGREVKIDQKLENQIFNIFRI